METIVELKYLVGIRNGLGSMMVVRDTEASRRNFIVIASGFDCEPAAAAWLDEQQARVDELNGRHCATCE
jgi:hypothetical protein